LPTEFGLLRGYPNPFNPAITISFSLPESGVGSLSIFDINGREVARLQQGWLNAGTHAVKWQPGNEASGLYFYRLVQGTNTAVGRAMYIK
ncbi:T9SS type A sorting domain-containing protein, partial [Candidatus Neomarinimicrobiota bacterium]